jgi:type I restriction enzyme S subunit
MVRGFPKIGDVVLTMEAPLGEVAQINDERVALAQRIVTLRGKKGLLDNSYLKYFFKSETGQSRLKERETGTTVSGIKQSELRLIEVDVPPISVQRRIAAILSSLDDKIELNRQTNQTLEAIAQTQFKEWFVDFNFPGTTGEMQDSELGPIPVGWRVNTLKDLTVKIGSGATPRGGSGVYLDEGTALIRSQNVYDSEFVWEGLARISDVAAEQLRNVEVKHEDVLLNITGASILRTCVVEPGVLPARVNQHVAIIRAIPGIPSRYIHLHLLQQKTKDYLMALDAGGSREAVTKGHIESVPILNPPFGLLECFDAVTAPVYSEIEQLSSQSRTLSTIRDTLLPKLMNGEIDVMGSAGVGFKPTLVKPALMPGKDMFLGGL